MSLLCLGAGLVEGLPSKWIRHYHERVAAFARENAALSPAKRYVVLVGDSLSEGWRYRERLKRYLPSIQERVLNRGITADGVGLKERGVKKRLRSSVFACQPSHVFLLIGVNDLYSQARVEPIAAAYAFVVKAIRAKLPQVPLILTTCAPVGGAYLERNPWIKALNKDIRRIAKDEGCGLLDLHALLANPAGALPEGMAADGLHFGAEGYRLWGQAIEGALRSVQAGATEQR